MSRWDQPHGPYVRRALLGTDLPFLEAIGFRRAGMVVELAFVVSEMPNQDQFEEIGDIEGELLADFEWNSYHELHSVVGLRETLDLYGFELVELHSARRESPPPKQE